MHEACAPQQDDSENAKDRKCCWGCAYILCFVSVETEAQDDATPGHQESKHVETCDLLSNKHQGSEPETGRLPRQGRGSEDSLVSPSTK